jgi:hypothetical protein
MHRVMRVETILHVREGTIGVGRIETSQKHFDSRQKFS